jgi:hypothetical protein
MLESIAVASAALAAFCGVRWARREAARVDANFKRAERRIKRSRDLSVREAITLRLDPATGVYRCAAE